MGAHRLGTAALLSPVLGASSLYVLNGATSTGPLLTMPSLRPSDGVLATNFSNPLPAASAAVAVWNGLLYAYGGQLASGAYTDQLRVFNPTTSTWTTLAPARGEDHVRSRRQRQALRHWWLQRGGELGARGCLRPGHQPMAGAGHAAHHRF
ncbi:Kelch repeat-containing protein [Hymenobacter ginkgonis]|nr:kelch repeat-containing protein [Hymenobacter ginkgonis]